jgi:hypothetical protein
MTMPQPLNQAVLTQALYDLYNGQSYRCLAMGFGEQELELLKQPELVARLVNARVLWCTVTVDREMVRRLAVQAREAGREMGAVDRMLRLGASSEMVCQTHGLTHQEVALRRDVLGLARRKGRYSTFSAAQEAELWQAGKAAVAERGIAPDDENARLELAMDLAESSDVPLAALWAAVQRWIAQAFVEQ